MTRTTAEKRIRTLLPIVFVVCVGFAPPVAAAAQRRGPFLLVALPSLGTASWSCGGQRGRDVALAFRVSPMGATTLVRFAAAGTARTVTLQPGQSAQFPLRTPGRQQLSVEQGTEARTLRATVVATFGRDQSYCFSYFPPRTTVSIWQGR